MRVSERSVQTFLSVLLFQNVVLTVQLHIHPETAWKLLPNISDWILQTIEKGYQYSPGVFSPRWSPAGSGNGTRSESSVREGPIEYVPHSNRETGLYSWYFIVPKKDGGLRPILDLRVLNDSVMQLKFKMLTLRKSCHRSDPRIGLSRYISRTHRNVVLAHMKELVI